MAKVKRMQSAAALLHDITLEQWSNPTCPCCKLSKESRRLRFKFLQMVDAFTERFSPSFLTISVCRNSDEGWWHAFWYHSDDASL